MLARRFIYILVVFLMATPFVSSEDESPLYLEEARSYEFIRGLERDTIFITGAVFKRDVATLLADTAIWIKGESIILIRDVYVQDSLYYLSADSVLYDIDINSAYAYGDTVIIISESDSILAKGTNAYYSRDSSIFRMSERPSVFINFHDTSRVVRVDAERIALDAEGKIGYADGQVIIEQEETETRSGRAIMYLEDDILLLLEEPLARRRESEIKGDTLVLFGDGPSLKRIYVTGNGRGNFKEPSEKDSTIFDVSELRASEIEFTLNESVLDNIVASGQAYSFYSPGSQDSSEIVRNNVSGDTIRLHMEDERLSWVQVIGGSEGEYLTGKYRVEDTTRTFTEDTVKYRSDFIDYTLRDSTIMLKGHASVENKSISLTAHRINYNTSRELVTAYDDSLLIDTTFTYFPVVLKDRSEEIIGSYLEYSMVTDRGMIWQSKSEYQEAYYRGSELFREEKDVYYVEGGSYTSCDQDSPHFHFQSSNMKMIQGDKIIARPVIFYIEKMPVMIIPYYVFPTKPGRHSGFLSFQIGNFERGQRYISNVGYYWAASEYWDILAALDYYEDFGLTYRSNFRYNLRYKMSGSVSGSYSNTSRFVGFEELKTKRWRLNFNHAQTISPTFNLRASGTFLSDKSYYTDFSTDLEDRLNRNLKSQVSLSKRFGSASLSAQFLHEVALDQEARTDRLPTATFSLSSRPLFGSPSRDESGKENRNWYHNIYSRYSVNLNNYSRRTTDTLGFRSRREYLTADHNASLSASFSLLKFLKLNPSFRYRETWYKIFETDQSLEQEIDASEFYRRYAYSTSLSASTDLYGTVSPNLFGLRGLRHVISPSVSFAWAPEITRHDNIKSYTGVGGGGVRQKTMRISLRHLFQAKVKSGEDSKKIDLFTVSSSVGYNFEAEDRKFSDVTTTLQTSLLKNINISATLVHELYKPGTDELDWKSPYLKSLLITTRFNTRGILGEYEKPATSEPPASGLGSGGATIRQTWSLSVFHHYSEYGRGAAFTKRHTVSFNGKINLTPSLAVSYNQSYNFDRDRTTSRRIEISKNLHCWEGHFYWVPDGSNQGYYFRLNVIAIPDIKIEKSESGIKAPYY